MTRGVPLTEGQKRYLIGLVLIDIENLKRNTGLDGQPNDKAAALAFSKRVITHLTNAKS